MLSMPVTETVIAVERCFPYSTASAGGMRGVGLSGDYIRMVSGKCAESYTNASARSVTLRDVTEGARVKCAESDARRVQVGRMELCMMIVLN
jgi:hypothetical protein